MSFKRLEDKWPPVAKYFYNRDTDWLQAESDAYRSMRKLFFLQGEMTITYISLKIIDGRPREGGGAT